MSENQFKTTISSKHKLFDLHIKETFGYRDLILLFVKRDFTAKYKQTILGPLWAIIQPLFTTVIFTLVFGRLADMATTDVAGTVLPGFLFYMAGNIIWGYFAGTLGAVSNTFLGNAGTMGKVYYPRLVAPISTAVSGMISFGIQFVMLIVVWVYYVVKGGTSIAVTPWLLLIPVTILQTIILAVGCGIIIASLTTKYRDLAMAVGFCITLWQYASPIAYGLGQIPERYMNVYLLNPVTPIITTFRYAIFGFGYFNLNYYLLSWAVSIVIFFIGLLLFSKIERSFMDTI